MSFPKGNLEGIQRHYSVHNLSHEIPKKDTEEEEEKRVNFKTQFILQQRKIFVKQKQIY